MPVTRDADYPQEMADLFQAFNRCADGHAADVVLDVALNFVVAAIGENAKNAGITTNEGVMTYARQVCRGVLKGVDDNWGRQPQPDDVQVSGAGH